MAYKDGNDVLNDIIKFQWNFRNFTLDIKHFEIGQHDAQMKVSINEPDRKVN